MDVKEEALGENHIDVARALHNVVVGLDGVGEHEGSLRCCVRAKDTRIAVHK